MAALALAESSSSVIGRITLDEKCAGKRSAGNPHAAFDEAGTGNGATSATAPVLDPTGLTSRCSVQGYATILLVDRTLRGRAESMLAAAGK